MLTDIYTSYATLSIGIPWNIPRVTCIFLVYTQAFRRVHTHKKVLHNYLYLVIENTVGSTINATHAQLMVGSLGVIPSNIQQLSCILIGCIFYAMV